MKCKLSYLKHLIKQATQSPQPVKIAPNKAISTEGTCLQIVSPLAASVVSIDTALGSQVKSGQTLVTLEAMKMNTTVSAGETGLVKTIEVVAGDSVEEGQALMTIEPTT